MSAEIYISHAWEKTSDNVLEKLLGRLHQEDFHVIYDHKDLNYGGSISTFMDDLARSEFVVLIISNKYLHSEYCMYELLKIYEQENIRERIFPIVLPEVQIAKSSDRLELIKYWENEVKNLTKKIKELDALTYLEGITDDLNLYQSIRNNIAKLTYILRDINALHVTAHELENFSRLVNSIKQKRTKRAKKRIVWFKPVKNNSQLSYYHLAGVILVLLCAIFLFRKFQTSAAVKSQSLISPSLIFDSAMVDSLKPTNNLASQNLHSEIDSGAVDNISLDNPNKKILLSQKASNSTQQNIKRISTDNSEPIAAKLPDIEESVENASLSDQLVEEEKINDHVEKDSPPLLTKSSITNSAPQTRKVVLPKNTILQVHPAIKVSTFQVQNGDQIPFKLKDNLVVNNALAIMGGSQLMGTVTRSQSYKKNKRAVLEIKFTSIIAVDGSMIPLLGIFSQNNRKSEIELNILDLFNVRTLDTREINATIE